MSRQNSIRWRESDLAELRRLAKNYNAKITRQRRKLIESDQRYQASQLPQKVSVRELRQDIGTRKDFNAELKRMQNFIDTGVKFNLDGNTKKSLQATVRDFNAKVDRLSEKAKSQGARAALPEKLNADELLKNASSPEHLKSQLRDFKGFLKRGAEKLVELPDTKHNIKLTQWQKETMEQMRIGINEARKAEQQLWKDAELTRGDVKTGITRSEYRMQKGKFEEYDPISLYNYSSTYGDMREKFKLMLRESSGEEYWRARTELSRLNYLKFAEENISYHPMGEEIIKYVESLPIERFKRVLLTEEDLYGDLYDARINPDKLDIVVRKIWNEWRPDDDYDEFFDNYLERKSNSIGG